MGKASQRKGRNAERELASVLQSYGYAATTGTPMNYGAEPDVSGLPGLHLEVKRAETIRLPTWLEQAERDAKRMNDGAPVVVFRRSREPWRVCLRLDDFMKLYGASQNHEQDTEKMGLESLESP